MITISTIFMYVNYNNHRFINITSSPFALLMTIFLMVILDHGRTTRVSSCPAKPPDHIYLD
ncbi:hypothetical protein HanIR_Chr16g0844291 [Helianthus annuus]|nr:hypothetical protein HanIR_Chr16g0844291 [Helianthus annuus]